MSPREKARVADWNSQSATIKPTGALKPPDESARELREGLFECLIDPFTALLVRVQRQSLQQADKNLTVHPGGPEVGDGHADPVTRKSSELRKGSSTTL